MHRLPCLLLATALILAAGDVSEDLLNASRKGDLETVKALVEKGAPLEAKTPYGQTPLYLAAMSGHPAVVQFLLDKGASTDVKDTFYKASLMDFVLERKHYDIAKMIIAKGNAKTDDLLNDVADSGRADLVQAVLEKGKPSQVVLDRIYEAALAQDKNDVAALLKKAGAAEPPPPFPVDAKVLDSYAGTFKSETFPLDLKVSVKDGKLYFAIGGQDPFTVKAKSATVFAFVPSNLEVEFDSPSSLMWKRGGMTTKFKKVVSQ